MLGAPSFRVHTPVSFPRSPVIPSAGPPVILATPSVIPSAGPPVILATPSVIPSAATPVILATPSVIPSAATPVIPSAARNLPASDSSLRYAPFRMTWRGALRPTHTQGAPPPAHPARYARAPFVHTKGARQPAPFAT